MFYIIEKQEQLNKLGPFGDCFVSFIKKSEEFHPKINGISLIYIRDLNQHKGYILCIEHNESLSLGNVDEWLINNTGKLWVIDKKETLYNFPYPEKLFDINFIEQPDLSSITIPAFPYYYNNHRGYPNINQLIPISKHYEKNELIFNIILPIINKYRAEDAVYAFNNGPLTAVFYNIEKQGIKINKKCFIDYYNKTLNYPEFNINKGKIYGYHNLHTITGRPSNVFNNINFLALNKTNGERLCFIPENDSFIELDIQGYHPRIIGELIDFKFDERNTYETLGELLDVTTEKAKELTFKQIYGGVWEEYQDKPFFKDVFDFTNKLNIGYKTGGVTTKNKNFISNQTDSSSTLLSWIVQSMETSKNVEILVQVLDYLKDKKTKLVLYTYDAFLFDYSFDDGEETLTIIKSLVNYPLNIKQGKTYHGLQKI